MPTNIDGAQEVLDSVTQTLGRFTWSSVLRLVLLIILCLVVKKLVMRVAEKAILRLKVAKSLHTFIKSVLNILLWFILILIVADYIGIPVTSLLAVLSLAGLAISLAIQGTLSNLAGGLMLLSAKPFAVGDYVEAAGISGTVMDIGLVYTRVTTPDNKLIFVPNSEISGAKIINYSAEENRRVDLVVSASYDAPVEQVEAILGKVLTGHPKVLDDPAPFARVSNYGSSAIEYTLRAWCANGDYWDVYFDLIRQVKLAFDQNGIEMTYDHINVHMMEK